MKLNPKEIAIEFFEDGSHAMHLPNHDEHRVLNMGELLACAVTVYLTRQANVDKIMENFNALMECESKRKDI